MHTSIKTISSLFDGLRFPELVPRYNIAPTQSVLCLRQTPSPSTGPEAQDTEAVMLRWGLVPFWAKDLKIGAKLINARSETVASKPAFRTAFKSRRCLVLADGFYEWKKIGKSKQPYYITRVDARPFCLAGLWESWQDDELGAEAETIETCTILTTQANSIMQPLHDRMPVFLGNEEQTFWLNNSFKDHGALEKLLVPCPDEDLQFREVSKIVNKVSNESPECIQSPEEPKTLF